MINLPTSEKQNEIIKAIEEVTLSYSVAHRDKNNRLKAADQSKNGINLGFKAHSYSGTSWNTFGDTHPPITMYDSSSESTSKKFGVVSFKDTVFNAISIPKESLTNGIMNEVHYEDGYSVSTYLSSNQAVLWIIVTKTTWIEGKPIVKELYRGYAEVFGSNAVFLLRDGNKIGVLFSCHYNSTFETSSARMFKLPVLSTDVVEVLQPRINRDGCNVTVDSNFVTRMVSHNKVHLGYLNGDKYSYANITFDGQSDEIVITGEEDVTAVAIEGAGEINQTPSSYVYTIGNLYDEDIYYTHYGTLLVKSTTHEGVYKEFTLPNAGEGKYFVYNGELYNVLAKSSFGLYIQKVKFDKITGEVKFGLLHFIEANIQTYGALLTTYMGEPIMVGRITDTIYAVRDLKEDLSKVPNVQ